MCLYSLSSKKSRKLTNFYLSQDTRQGLTLSLSIFNRVLQSQYFSVSHFSQMDALATKTQKYWQYTFLWIEFLNKCWFLFINYQNLMISNWITTGPVKYENTVHQKLFFIIKISLQSSTKLIIRKTSMNIRIILAFNG